MPKDLTLKLGDTYARIQKAGQIITLNAEEAATLAKMLLYKFEATALRDGVQIKLDPGKVIPL